ncbi:MAG: SUMF1/EgtB/PvdO family nonheme iron enzyme [Planctomycetota bacterium]|jgi:formylglycine-generating enzyme required for sulfatase activity
MKKPIIAFLLLITSSAFGSLKTIDFSSSHNARMQDFDPTNAQYFPEGHVVLGGVHFIIPSGTNNIWQSNASPGSPDYVEITVGEFGVVGVHTLINTHGGVTGGPYAWLEFFGTNAAYHRKDLYGDDDVRDYYENWYTNNINGTTTTNVFKYGSGYQNEVRLDKQWIDLAPGFHTETLTSIRLTDNGAPSPGQSPFLAGITVEYIPEPPCGVDVEWVTVGDAANSADNTGYGSVGDEYRIGKYEVTNSQYCAFLNAVATSEDTHGLYNANMASGHQDTGGIIQSGSAGAYSYSVRTGRENHPVNYVSWYDALHFCNWLHNGQPAGVQDSSTTEDGAYNMSLGLSVTRKAGATVFLPSEDEWYKAAYYKGGGTNAGYWEYATQSDTVPTAESPPGTDMVNGSANYNSVIGGFTDVGAYTTKPSDSAYGTFGQNGNVWEWNEALISGDFHGMRGGSQGSLANRLPASYRDNGNPGEDHHIGFRVASSPEPPEWSFVHLADPQMNIPLSSLVNWDLALAATLYKVKHCRPQPDFILISGDVADYAWWRFHSPPLPLDVPALWNYLAFDETLAILGELKDRVYVVPGNHDGYLYNELDFLELCPTKECLLNMFKEYVGHSYDFTSHYRRGDPLGTGVDYTFDHKEFLFVGLDSKDGQITEEQFAALEALENDVPKILFFHHPPVLQEVPSGPVPGWGQDILDYCTTNNVQLVLVGHEHENEILCSDGETISPNLDTYPQFVQTSSASHAWFFKDDPSYRLVEIRDNKAYPQQHTTTIKKWLIYLTATLFSPANVHVYDNNGNHVGVTLSGSIDRDIPNSVYFSHKELPGQAGIVVPEKIVIFDPCDEYTYKVVGSEVGTYRLMIGFGEDGNEVVFEANDIPTLAGSVHEYTIDWDALSQGEDGVIIRVDIDGDGQFEKQMTADSLLTAEEFDAAPVANAGGPYVEMATSWSGAVVELDGTGSYDPDGDDFTYAWDLDLAADSGGDGDPCNDTDSDNPKPAVLFPIGQTDIALIVKDAYGVSSVPDITTVTVSFIEVEIDIKPGSLTNAINLGSNGVIPVAFLSDAEFDASTIDPATVTLRGQDLSDGLVKLRGKKDAPVPMSCLEDVDGDGDSDLVVHLDTEKLAEYELEAVCEIGALTYDGYVVSGTDIIAIVPQ